MTTRQTPDAVREAIITAITKADKNFGYSYRLTKMDDTGEEHTLFMDGFDPIVFRDREDGYPVIEQRRNAARAAAILAALDGRAGDAGEVMDRSDAQDFADFYDLPQSAMLAVTPAPAVDAVPAGEVGRAYLMTGPWELDPEGKSSGIYMDDPEGGDPICLCAIKRVYHHDLLSAALSHGEGRK